MSHYQITARSFPNEDRANAFATWVKAEGLTSARVVPSEGLWNVRLDTCHFDLYQTSEFFEKEQEWLHRPSFFNKNKRGLKAPFLKSHSYR